MESKIVKSDFKKLNQFLRELEHSADYVVRVGIMGQKNSRPDGHQTNADIGFVHEYGKPKTAYRPAIPKRSFLRLPLRVKSELIIQEVQLYIEFMKKKGKLSLMEILVNFGIACERAIDNAFETGGFGSWKKNTPYTIAHKRGGTKPLIDLGFLRKSITSEVVKR